MMDYEKIVEDFSWILEPQNIILSPDSDWMLCGLLLTKFTNSKIVWWYDWKIMLIKDWYEYQDCTFVDMDINRSNIKSVWHHCVIFNKRITGLNFNYRENCIQPNIIRNFDGKNDFQQKYPFGTVHLLICILHHAWLISSIDEQGIRPMLFTDWVWNNLFWYTENCLERIDYMWINNPKNPLYYHFCGNQHSFYEIMQWLDSFLRMRDTYNAEWYYDWVSYIIWGRNKRTWDKLKFSKPNWEPINLVWNWTLYNIHEIEKVRIENFIKSMARYLWREYKEESWYWWDLHLKTFSKWDFKNINLTNSAYLDLMSNNPFSMAMTSSDNIEYTLDIV